MTEKWITGASGIRYRESADRRLKNGRADRYYAIRYYVEGKRREEGLGWASEGWTIEKAQGVLGALKESSRTGQGPRTLQELRESNAARRETDRYGEARITLADFFDRYYIPQVQKSKRTWSHDVGRFNKELRYMLGDIPLCEIGQGHMQTLLDTLRKNGAAEATVLQYMAIMRQIFNMARKTYQNGSPLYTEQQSPVDAVRLPKATMERERFLTYEEADQLIACAGNVSADLVHIIILSLNTGLRFGEMLRLEWTDVNLPYAIVSVRVEDMRKPGGKVPLNEEALAVLRERNRQRPKSERFVFPESVTGKDGYPLRRQFTELVEECGLNIDSTSARDKVVFHTLRHTFASWLAISGKADIYRIKTLMRHKTIKMTERYAHLLPDATRDAVNHLRPSASLQRVDSLKPGDSKSSDNPSDQ